MNRAARRRQARHSRRHGRGATAPPRGAGGDPPFTFTLFTEHGTQHVHVFPPGFVCDHTTEAEDAADWWRGMRPAPWTSPPWVMETVMSCGCELIITGDPRAFDALAADIEQGAPWP